MDPLPRRSWRKILTERDDDRSCACGPAVGCGRNTRSIKSVTRTVVEHNSYPSDRIITDRDIVHERICQIRCAGPVEIGDHGAIVGVHLATPVIGTIRVTRRCSDPEENGETKRAVAVTGKNAIANLQIELTVAIKVGGSEQRPGGVSTHDRRFKGSIAFSRQYSNVYRWTGWLRNEQPIQWRWGNREIQSAVRRCNRQSRSCLERRDC
jgi:hypothetical protein